MPRAEALGGFSWALASRVTLSSRPTPQQARMSISCTPLRCLGEGSGE
jgi:hypothetical protein